MIPVSPAAIRLVVVDIDGTIAGRSNTIRPNVLAALQTVQAQGIPVALATGRMYRSALRFHQMVGSTLPLVAYQGAWIQDPAQPEQCRQVGVPVEVVAELLDYFEQPSLQPQISVHLYINDQLYVREVLEETVAYADRSGVTPTAVGDLRSLLTAAPTKLLAMSANTDLITQTLAQLKSRFSPQQLYLTTSVAHFLEATHPSVNKGAAVRYLAEDLLGLKAANVMAIGDNFNDLEMLEYAGVGVAMGDAPAAVKQVAQWVAPSVDEDGAAIAIHRFLLDAESQP
jgi:hypothetical protein